MSLPAAYANGVTFGGQMAWTNLSKRNAFSRRFWGSFAIFPMDWSISMLEVISWLCWKNLALCTSIWFAAWGWNDSLPIERRWSVTCYSNASKSWKRWAIGCWTSSPAADSTGSVRWTRRQVSTMACAWTDGHSTWLWSNFAHPPWRNSCLIWVQWG